MFGAAEHALFGDVLAYALQFGGSAMQRALPEYTDLPPDAPAHYAVHQDAHCAAEQSGMGAAGTRELDARY